MVKVQKPQPKTLSKGNKIEGIAKEKQKVGKTIKKAKATAPAVVDSKKSATKKTEIKKATKKNAVNGAGVFTVTPATPPAKSKPSSKKPLVLAPPESPATPAPKPKAATKVAKNVAPTKVNATKATKIVPVESQKPKKQEKVEKKPVKQQEKPKKQVPVENKSEKQEKPVEKKSEKPEKQSKKQVPVEKKTAKLEKQLTTSVAKNAKKQPQLAKKVAKKVVKVVATKVVKVPKGKGKPKGRAAKKQKKVKKVVELDYELKGFDEDKFNEIVCESNVEKVCNALKSQVAEEVQKQKATSIFSDYRYILQVACYKIPSCPKRVVKLALKHSLVGTDDDVAFIVTDLQRGARFDYEPTVQHYEDLLREAGVEQRLSVVPFNRLRNDMTTFEAKRKFLNSYDYLLCDGRISGQASAFLGQHTLKPRNVLHAVRMSKTNQLKEEISRALCRTAYRQLRKGDLTAIPVGNHEHSGPQLTENILGIVKQLQQQYPGGLANVRSMYLKIDIVGTSALPLYISMCAPPADTPYVVGPREQRMLKLKKQANEVLTRFALTKDVDFIKLTKEQVKHKAELREKRLALKAAEAKESAKDGDGGEESAVPAKKARKNPPLQTVQPVDESDDEDDDEDEEDDDEDEDEDED
ncbi:ribosomal L1 domain-containing protein CG13096 isoform X2 [Drosophila grimshawi]|uniref:ribosomal L1 domain-containing protein CG13096 isoform X2 n=1 Tax=Drosophila grimshawi TaxID=7222 RepID=UPI000C86FBFF|nr:ribosomal L1 domain-containing protein CG13096 isoform X2 [Drosophila grimshawi]